MDIFYSEHQLHHAPARELQDGEMVPYAEKPERLTSILAAVGSVRPAEDHGIDPITDVHDKGYIDFLQSAHKEWQVAGRPGDAFPYAFPIRGRRPLDLDRIDAKLGRYAYDCGTPIAEHTWTAAYWNTQTALSALHNVLDGNKRAFALCRPPGHHAGADYMGGYCYLNNVAIAAEAALTAGASRVSVLDVDYHHGNGTQDIFYQRPDVFTVSIHADPKTDYPFYWGHSDEIGEGRGNGQNLNLPLPRGTDWPAYAEALKSAISAISEFKPDLLIVPYGADTYKDDPISHFNLTTPDYTEMASDIAALSLPTLICMEGGYAVDALGTNVQHFLAGFDVGNG
ncbi:MAG: histone deacetylase family protein [Pseudomonadota bacterium]